MTSICINFLEFKKLLDIRNRIKYYLGPLYNKDVVYVDNLISIDNMEIDTNLNENPYFIELKFILNKYKFLNKQFIYIFGDIMWKVNDYALVKNKYINIDDKSIILRNLEYQRHWSQFYSINDTILFKDKINKVFWRGSTTGYPYRPGNRFTLVEKYFKKYDNIDIAFSSICQNKENYKKYMDKQLGWVSISYFLKYKYILSVEGNDKDSGINWKLASNSLVLMAKPRAFSWLMENMLIPDYHYILLKDDFSNLREKVDWCNKHPKEVQQIIKNANEYMNMFLNIKQEEYIEREVLRLYFEKIKKQNL